MTRTTLKRSNLVKIEKIEKICFMFSQCIKPEIQNWKKSDLISKFRSFMFSKSTKQEMLNRTKYWILSSTTKQNVIQTSMVLFCFVCGSELHTHHKKLHKYHVQFVWMGMWYRTIPIQFFFTCMLLN